MKNILITGAAGFIGHHLVAKVLRDTDWTVTVIDRLDTSGNLNRLAEIGAVKNPRVRFIYHDLKASINPLLRKQIGHQDYIAHLAAATHVDRSISNPMEFVMDNVVATCNLLDYARDSDCEAFLQFSTDEVFGPAPSGVSYKEDDRYRCGNPYAATKAGAEELAISYFNTYKLPVIVTHTMNVIGKRQHPEKYLPLVTGKVLEGGKVSIHGDKTKTKAGSRFYIDAENVADAVMFLIENGGYGQKYNIVGEREVDNLELAKMIAEVLKKSLNYEIVDFHSSRPGHDLRYALDGTKMKQMGWTPDRIEHSVESIVKWTVANSHWL